MLIVGDWGCTFPFFAEGDWWGRILLFADGRNTTGGVLRTNYIDHGHEKPEGEDKRHEDRDADEDGHLVEEGHLAGKHKQRRPTSSYSPRNYSWAHGLCRVAKALLAVVHTALGGFFHHVAQVDHIVYRESNHDNTRDSLAYTKRPLHDTLAEAKHSAHDATDCKIAYEAR